ncbi:uncharacterized protein EI90DRAFT_3086349 [Cantharellus anzutake]|uniref:uncharacterized protein n=1 Tax=Cantharellus anzutake TaxID=1750568 RepID=UPI00190627CF|nr:uncharacterized protein EI90DRAFT_3086349 [Cantharellus anzutake]KAF8316481.1 hypothetical protein EI90DRAFT_3086349 [Cantharellus anzutake]
METYPSDPESPHLLTTHGEDNTMVENLLTNTSANKAHTPHIAECTWRKPTPSSLLFDSHVADLEPLCLQAGPKVGKGCPPTGPPRFAPWPILSTFRPNLEEENDVAVTPTTPEPPAIADVQSLPLNSPLHPKDGLESYNYIDLEGELENFRAHGDHLQKWQSDPGAILVLPLDAHYNSGKFHSICNDLTTFLKTQTLCVIPPVANKEGQSAPWGFFVGGLHPMQAHLLVTKHLWLSRAIGFIAINLLTYSPTSYVVTIHNIGANLDEADQVQEAITAQIANPDSEFHTFFKKYNIPEHEIKAIIDKCVAIPRGYEAATCTNWENPSAKRNPTSNSQIKVWEIHIPSPFFSVPDLAPGVLASPHDLWLGLFRTTTFPHDWMGEGSAIQGNIMCHTCKGIDHSFWLCPIHDHASWHELNPQTEKTENAETPHTAHRGPPNRKENMFRPRGGRGNSKKP